MFDKLEAKLIRKDFWVNCTDCEVVVKAGVHLAAWFKNHPLDLDFSEGLMIKTPYGVVMADGFWNSYFGKKRDEHIRFVGPSEALCAIFYPYEMSNTWEEKCHTKK